MEFSISLLRHRLASRREQSRRDAPGAPLPRPDGRLLWAHFGRGIDPLGGRLVLDRVVSSVPDLNILTTGVGSEVPAPVDAHPAVPTFLDAWRPDLALFLGSDPFPVLWTQALRRGLPLLAAETDTARHPLSLIRPMTLFDAVLATAPDPRLGAVAQVLGPLSTVPPPPRMTTALNPLRQAVATRPVWLALDVPGGELDAVLAAHERVAQLSHRLLLILAPNDANETRTRLSDGGWRFATRSDDEDPAAEDRVLLVDEPEEIGDWLRLAPVTYLGGTLTGAGPRTSPFAPASLGSAVIHGSSAGNFAREIERLDEAHAARRIADAAGLAAELARLQSPETAADLARAGWTVTSEGAEASAALVEQVADVLVGIRP